MYIKVSTVVVVKKEDGPAVLEHFETSIDTLVKDNVAVFESAVEGEIVCSLSSGAEDAQ